MTRWLLVLLAAWFFAPCAAAADASDASDVPQVMVMLHLPAPHFRADASYAGSYRHDSGRTARRRVAGELARKHGLKLGSDWPMPVLGVDCYVMLLPQGGDAARMAAVLAHDTRVEWAQPVSQFKTLAAGDPLYAVQPVALQWRLDDLHRTATGRSMTVAVIDSGIDDQHPDLAGQVTQSQNFIDGQSFVAEPHGTAVAGIIAARADNGIGIRGVAPGARLLSLRACRQQPGAGAQCDSFSLGKALNFAILQAPQVINLSLTGPADRLMQRLLDAALARGIAVVGAADPGASDGGFPASWPGVLSVGGEAAPGKDIPTTLPGGGFGMVSGSSYSSAHVSGLLALLGEAHPGSNAVQMRAFLQGSQPLIDACAAVGRAASRCVCGCATTASLKAPRLP